MKKIRKNWSIYLSLIVLASFLTFYIFSAYKSEKVRIEKQVAYIFSNTIGELERTSIRSVLLPETEYASHIKEISQIHIIEKKDSSNPNKTNLNVEIRANKSSNTKDSDKKIVFRTSNIKIENPENKQIDGMLSFALKSKKSGEMSFGSNKSIKEYLPEIAKLFEQNLKKDKIEVVYFLETETKNIGNISLIKYKDLGTQETVSLVLGNTFGSILMTIWPQILGCLLLFSLVCFSFILVLNQNQKAQELLENKNNFINNMSHELKTPLSTVSVALEALEKFDLQNIEQRKSYFEIGKTEINKLNELVNKVLNISSSNFGKQEKLKIELNEMLNTLIPNFEIRGKERGFGFEYFTFKDEIWVESNAEILKSSIQNLFDNALKYCVSKNPIIKVSIYDENHSIIISVKDNGIGIEPKYQKQIFEQFYRIPEKNNSHTVKGHGLGLSIVKKGLESIGAEIELISNAEGNDFQIKIPKNNA